MCGLTCGVRIIGLLSILLAAAVVGTSSWLLKTSYEQREGNLNRGASFVTNLANQVSGSNVKPALLVDTNIKIWVSAASLAAGALQLITSIFLLFCSSSKGGRTSAKLWLFINFFVILAVAGSFICVMYRDSFRKDLENDDREHQLKAFLASTGADAVFLFIFSFITGSFGCRSES